MFWIPAAVASWPLTGTSVASMPAAVQHHDPRSLDVEALDLGLQDLRHGCPDLDVVEADVGLSARAAGVEPVVLDDLDAGLLGQVDDGGARARVDADEQDHAGPVGDRLLGLRLLLGGIALGVDDRVLDVGVRECLLEEAPVVALPARRRGAVGQEHPDAALAAAVPPVTGGSARVARPFVVVATTAGRGKREHGDGEDDDPKEPPGSSAEVRLTFPQGSSSSIRIDGS